jgi:hypothetical protein
MTQEKGFLTLKTRLRLGRLLLDLAGKALPGTNTQAYYHSYLIICNKHANFINKATIMDVKNFIVQDSGPRGDCIQTLDARIYR